MHAICRDRDTDRCEHTSEGRVGHERHLHLPLLQCFSTAAVPEAQIYNKAHGFAAEPSGDPHAEGDGSERASRPPRQTHRPASPGTKGPQG